MTESSTPRSELWAGLKDTIPLMIGALPFGLIFGATALTYGLSPAAVAGMSAFVFAGSAQFIGAGMVHNGAPIPIIVLTTFVVNLRHALYSASLAPYLKGLSQRWIVPLSFWLTDETFVIVIRRFEQPDESPHKHWYFLGSELGMYINWQFWTWVGIFAGSRIDNPARWGLDFAMIVTFIGMVVPAVKTRPTLVSVIVAGAVAVLANPLPYNLGLLLAALCGVVAGMATQSQINVPETKAAETTEVAS
jgi:4-azaleucine resistance transporter AzlC